MTSTLTELTLANSLLYDSVLCELPGLWDLELPGDNLSTAPKETPQDINYSLAIKILLFSKITTFKPQRMPNR